MKITAKRCNKYALTALKPGDVFIYNGRYMLKTKHELPDCTILCVDIETGDYIYLKHMTTICRFSAEVRIL